MGSVTDVKSFILGAVMDERPLASGKTRRNTERSLHFFNIQPDDAANGSRGSENTTGARGVPTRTVMRLVGTAGFQSATSQVVTQNHRHDEFFTVNGVIGQT